MPFLRDFDELVSHQKRSGGGETETEPSRVMPTSSLSDRIKALETAGIIDSFVKKRVPPYAAAAAVVGSSLQDTVPSVQPDKPATKIYHNPSTGFHAQQPSKTNLAASSSTNLHSSSSRESLASNEAAPGGLPANLYRSTSVDSIENELPGPATSEALLGFYQHLERELDAAGFFHPPEKTPNMIQNLRSALGRAAFTDQEVRTFRGVVTALSRGRGKVLEKLAKTKKDTA